MNKLQFISHMADQHSLTKTESEKIIDMFTSSVISALGKGEEISLVGFGNFTVSKVAARAGRNPQTAEVIQIKAYNKPKFKAGQKLKDVVNK